MPVPSLLAVYAHPDDESLSSGGVLARHAAAGARTAVVTATWAEDTGRGAELAEALRILGAGRPRMLGYADARVPQSAPGRARWCDAPLDEAVGALVAHLREFRPEIVVTHDAYGGVTGHPDHVHTHRVTVLAVQASGLGRLYPDAGAPWQPSALYQATHPQSAERTLNGHLARAGRAAQAMYTLPDEQVTATVDVSPWLDQKWAAVLAHRSQVEGGSAPGLIAAFPSDIRERLLSTEYYARHDLTTTAPRQSDLTA
ncbi:N-acetyl-1-D-myo-inositol-2-amino-2-deoxy-alpha-D-glucopyranoside deacetylase [Kitasatospora sp. MAA4]|uniref:PIG-L family deacetylase n=1 Tax=Kitasatospora sp. MAA4 TaxID=3035093 RepID=UPI002474C351|nr:PIG-L family deacetylase [Kitasatospora sp. MAA4]MDH6136826.1 N-acetyl-1-D-myo-inositol-2-amino-2-deoxy-alpha-D-glucopyranoside deacetylase [Kitasatospora sp. MAA4]